MEFVMMTGLDGSGRREYAQTLGHTVVYTEDEAVALLKNGTSCVLDAPNLRARSRKAFLERLGRIRCRRRIVLTARNVDLCKGALPDEAENIHDQYLSFYPPQPYEGWDDISLVFAEDAQFIALDELFSGKMGLCSSRRTILFTSTPWACTASAPRATQQNCVLTAKRCGSPPFCTTSAKHRPKPLSTATVSQALPRTTTVTSSPPPMRACLCAFPKPWRRGSAYASPLLSSGT